MPISPNGTSFSDRGNPDNPAIILIHGLGLNRSTWGDYITPLSRHHRVISYDLFGHGDSAALSRTPDLTLFAQQIIDLMDCLGIEKSLLVGFSLGGMINRRLALDAPHRVAGLVILNSPHERGAEQQKLVERRAKTAASDGIEASIEQVMQRWFTPEFRKNNQAAVARARNILLANDLESYAACRIVLAAGVTELMKPTPPISCPALVMTCENDSGSTPKMARGIAAEIAQSSLIILPKLQHLGLIERPNLFIKPIEDFISAARDKD